MTADTEQETGTRPGARGGTLALFPGMAAAFPGMARPLVGLAAAERVFEEFSVASGVDVGAVASTGGEGHLFRDRVWELTVVATEAAALEAWRASGNGVTASLGFSIGAYAALLAASAVTVEQVVAMIDVVLEASLRVPGHFAMLAVSGASFEHVVSLCRPGEVELAAVIAPGRLLLAGTEDAVRTLVDTLRPRALTVRVLAVRWPLHTSLMRQVSVELERRRERLGALLPPHHPVYSAVDGARIATPEEGWRLLVDHLHRPQRFDLAFGAARADGVRRCVELGPTGTLTGAVRWLAGDAIAVEAFPDRGPRRRASEAPK